MFSGGHSTRPHGHASVDHATRRYARPATPKRKMRERFAKLQFVGSVAWSNLFARVHSIADTGKLALAHTTPADRTPRANPMLTVQ